MPAHGAHPPSLHDPISVPDGGDRNATLRDTVQNWCSVQEAALRENPESWLFWLDKNWTRVCNNHEQPEKQSGSDGFAASDLLPSTKRKRRHERADLLAVAVGGLTVLWLSRPRS